MALPAVGAQLAAVTLDQCKQAAVAAVNAKGSLQAREEATAILGG